MQKILIGSTMILVGLLLSCTDGNKPRSSKISSQSAEEISTDLSDLITSGAVLLVKARGNGAASGNSIDAILRNNTSRRIDVDIYMRKPLFLRNNGVGQNMIALKFYGADGSYMQKDGRSVVTLLPNTDFNSSMVAYCADFEKENPTSNESFSIDEPPTKLVPVISRIIEYIKANPDANVTVAAQLAIWLAQGEGLSEIARKYEFTNDDKTLAYSFIQ